jgi:hypothetical protein
LNADGRLFDAFEALVFESSSDVVLVLRGEVAIGEYHEQ